MKKRAIHHVVAIVAMQAYAQCANGASIGGIEIRSKASEHLYAIATLSLNEGDKVEAQCVSVQAHNETGTDIELASPSLLGPERMGARTVSLGGGQLHFEKGANAQKIEVRSRKPINERIIYLTVALRCGSNATRTFATYLPGSTPAVENARDAVSRVSSRRDDEEWKAASPDGIRTSSPSKASGGAGAKSGAEQTTGVRLRLAPLLSSSQQSP